MKIGKASSCPVEWIKNILESLSLPPSPLFKDFLHPSSLLNRFRWRHQNKHRGQLTANRSISSRLLRWFYYNRNDYFCWVFIQAIEAIKKCGNKFDVKRMTSPLPLTHPRSPYHDPYPLIFTVNTETTSTRADQSNYRTAILTPPAPEAILIHLNLLFIDWYIYYS